MFLQLWGDCPSFCMTPPWHVKGTLKQGSGEGEQWCDLGQGTRPRGLPLREWQAVLGLFCTVWCPAELPTQLRKHSFHVHPVAMNSLKLRYQCGHLWEVFTQQRPPERSEILHSIPMFLETTTNYKVSKIWFLTQTQDRKFSWTPPPTHTHRATENKRTDKMLEVFSPVGQWAAPHSLSREGKVMDQLPHTRVCLDVQTQIKSFHNSR